MVVKTCLLISDDPDDHIEFSEAINEISDEVVVVSVSDMRKAIDLLKLNKCLPDFVLLNLTIPEFDPDHFFGTLNEDPVFNHVQVVAFGEARTMPSPRIRATFGADMSYSELKNALRNILGTQGNR